MPEAGDGVAPSVEQQPVGVDIPPGVVSRSRSRHPIVAFLARRVLTGLATLVVASFLIFLATNALPGNVAQHVLGKNATPQLVKSLDRQLHLNRPVLARYGSWIGGVVQGDLGQSAVALAQGASSAPVSGLIGTPLRNSAGARALDDRAADTALPADRHSRGGTRRSARRLRGVVCVTGARRPAGVRPRHVSHPDLLSSSTCCNRSRSWRRANRRSRTSTHWCCR